MTYEASQLWSSESGQSNLANIDQIITACPHLINEINPDDEMSVIQTVLSDIAEPGAPALAKKILQHPSFIAAEEDISALIMTANYELVAEVVNKPFIHRTGFFNKLTYCEVLELLDSNERNLTMQMNKALNDAVEKKIKFHQTRIDAFKKMLPLLRTAAIDYAIQTDDVSIIDELQEAGAEPMFSELNEQGAPLHTRINQEKQPNLFSWCEKIKQVTAASSDVYSLLSSAPTNSPSRSDDGLALASTNSSARDDDELPLTSSNSPARSDDGLGPISKNSDKKVFTPEELAELAPYIKNLEETKETWARIHELSTQYTQAEITYNLSRAQIQLAGTAALVELSKKTIDDLKNQPAKSPGFFSRIFGKSTDTKPTTPQTNLKR